MNKYIIGFGFLALICFVMLMFSSSHNTKNKDINAKDVNKYGDPVGWFFGTGIFLFLFFIYLEEHTKNTKNNK